MAENDIEMAVQDLRDAADNIEQAGEDAREIVRQYFPNELSLYFSSMFYFSVSNSCSAQFCPSFSSGLKSLAISPV